MAKIFDISLKGDKKMEAALARAGSVTRTAAEKAIAEEAQEIADDERRGAPSKTGKLRGSIAAHPKGLEAEITATARYATYVEHGTYKDPAQPFALPAAEKARPRFRSRLGKAVGSAVEAVR